MLQVFDGGLQDSGEALDRLRLGPTVSQAPCSTHAPLLPEVNLLEVKDSEVGRVLVDLLRVEDGGAAAQEAVTHDVRFVAALRRLLYAPWAGDLVEVRCRAVWILSSIGAVEVLIDYLDAAPKPETAAKADAELAVINATARALSGLHSARALNCLLRAALHWHAIEATKALASFDDPRTLPALIGGLHIDQARAVAEAALLRISWFAAPALLDTVLRTPRPQHLDDIRARRSAARLLSRFALSERQCEEFATLLEDPDVEVSAHACMAVLKNGRQSLGASARAGLRARFDQLTLPSRRKAEKCLHDFPSLRSPGR